MFAGTDNCRSSERGRIGQIIRHVDQESITLGNGYVRIERCGWKRSIPCIRI